MRHATNSLNIKCWSVSFFLLVKGVYRLVNSVLMLLNNSVYNDESLAPNFSAPNKPSTFSPNPTLKFSLELLI